VDDADLVELFRKAYAEGGAPALRDRAWRTFVEQFGRTVDFTIRRWCRHYRHPGEAEDLIQEVYVRLQRNDCRALREFVVGRARMKTWLITICTNVCTGWYRSRNRPVFAPPPPPSLDGGTELVREQKDEHLPLADIALLSEEEAHEKIRILAHCISELEDTKRLFFITRLLGMVTFEKNLSITDIGRIHFTSPQTAKYRLDTAQELLGKCMRAKERGVGGGA